MEAQQRLWYPIYNICVRTNAANIQYEEFSCILHQSIQETPNAIKALFYSTYQSYVSSVCVFLFAYMLACCYCCWLLLMCVCVWLALSFFESTIIL